MFFIVFYLITRHSRGHFINLYPLDTQPRSNPSVPHRLSIYLCLCHITYGDAMLSMGKPKMVEKLQGQVKKNCMNEELFSLWESWVLYSVYLLFSVLPFFLSTEGSLQWHRKCNSHVPLLYTALLFLYNTNYHTASFVPSKQQQPAK